MRILVFHGYLLSGTGSNVYNARLAAAFVKQGHEVHLLCQDRHPERQPFVDTAGDWDVGALTLHELSGPRRRGEESEAPAAGRCTVYRPNIGDLLPVYVADRYEAIQARTFAECSDEEVTSYVEANVAAVREVVELAAPDVALANHLVMGPAILARALGGRVPYAVKVHGSALEYTVKPEPDRFLAYAREGVEGAGGILVGSHHTAASLWQALADPQIERRTRLGPPGVDVERFVPRERSEAMAGVGALATRLCALGEGHEGVAGGTDAEASAGDAFARDERAAGEALAAAGPRRGQAGGVRRQADRQQGRGSAARGVAAGARDRPERAARGDRLRRLPRRFRAPARRAAARRRRARARRSRGLGARWRPIRRRGQRRAMLSHCVTCWHSSTGCRARPASAISPLRARSASVSC